MIIGICLEILRANQSSLSFKPGVSLSFLAFIALGLAVKGDRENAIFLWAAETGPFSSQETW